MNSKTILKKLSEKQLDEKYKIVSCRSDANHPVITHYAVKKNKIEGEGKFGEVRKAYPFNIATNEINQSQPFAVKIFKNANEFNRNEAVYFNNKSARIENIVRNKNEILVFMEYLPGKELIKETVNPATDLTDKKVHDIISKLSFQQRIQLISCICLSINLIHHNTPTTGSALIHADIKGSNIKIKLDLQKGVFHVYIMDFGLSEKIIDDPSIQNDSSMRGTTEYSPYEIFADTRGIKSDIYSLVPLFLFILGAKNPFSARDNLDINDFDYPSTGYVFDGIFSDCILPNYPIDVKFYIEAFLNRMQATEYKQRPDSDEVLQFFISLHNFCKIYDEDPSDTVSLNKHGAKLIMLASGLWHQHVGTRHIDVISNDQEKMKQYETLYEWRAHDEIKIHNGHQYQKLESTETHECKKSKELPAEVAHFDFEFNPDICAAIVKQSDNKPLNTTTVLNLLNKSPEQETFIEKEATIHTYSSTLSFTQNTSIFSKKKKESHSAEVNSTASNNTRHTREI